MKKVTIGGNRLGSGKKMKVTQRGFDRSTDNLSTIVRTSAAPGVLTPVYNYPMLPGDTIDMDLESIVRTYPTIGPLFGSYKEQIDVFFCPMRLYQGIMHDNPVNIGMEMSKVILPKILLRENSDTAKKPYSSTSLINYLGLTGFGTITGQAGKNVGRKIEAVDLLAYYDIFKNYYANKQEDNAKVIVGTTKLTNEIKIEVSAYPNGIYKDGHEISLNTPTTWVPIVTPTQTDTNGPGTYIFIYAKEELENLTDIANTAKLDVAETKSVSVVVSRTIAQIQDPNDPLQYEGRVSHGEYKHLYAMRLKSSEYNWLAGIVYNTFQPKVENTKLVDFPLSNIDEMRRKCLAANQPGEEFILNMPVDLMPYSVVAGLGTPDYIGANYLPMNGLVVKTYQNDILNNWINTEWVDGRGAGENGNPISYITRVQIQNGAFTMDTLNMAQKLYNMMTEVAVGDGTIRAWQNAVYNVDGYGLSEIPIYVGGMSGEVVFEEIVSLAETETNASGNSPIGTLAGKGTLVGKKGGKITYKAKEPGIIMAILSLTPRIDYSQGNKWHLTEINTMDDFHKPALDGIGFQDLIGENMHWANTTINADEQTNGVGEIEKKAIGKTPAWQWYRTDINRTYGDFADKNKAMFMTLNRQYEVDILGNIKDATAYIDPKKYNYCFADASLTAQNFWVQIKFDIKMRHFMSARNVLPYMR